MLTGKDVGRRGKVLEVIPDERRVIVEHINIVKRHTKPRPVKGTRGAQMTPGGVLEIEAPLRIDNVALVCPRCSEANSRRLPDHRQWREGPPLPPLRLPRRHREDLIAMAETTITPPRLRGRYESEVRDALQERFAYHSPMQLPRLSKITLNMGVGEAKQNSKALDEAVEQLAIIAGQRPLITKAKKSIAGFKLREGMPIGCKVTLRGARMWEFLDRLMAVALPRIRDFRGLDPGSFDGRGNYSLGVREQIIFPEIDYDRIDTVRGLDVTITTTANTDEEARELLRALGMPFREA